MCLKDSMEMLSWPSSPFQPFLLINLGVNLIHEDLLGIEPLQDSFSNYPGKADPTNRQQGYFQHV